MSIALLGEMFLAVLGRPSHNEMYERKDSQVFCAHSQSSLNDVGRFDVPWNMAMNIFLSSSHDPVDPRARLLSQAHATSQICNCNSCIALSIVPPLTVTVVKKSSSQILRSYCPLNLMVPLLILSPFGRGVVQMYKLKHSTL
jgi:hypothetical protein